MKVGPVINTPFLNHLGLLQRLPIWRAAFRNRKSVNLDLELTAAAEADTAVLPRTSEKETANILPGSGGETQTITSGHSENSEAKPAFRAGRYRRGWAYAATVGIVVLLAVWFKTHSGLDEGEPVYARTTAFQPAPVATPSSPSSAQTATEPAKATPETARKATPEVAVSEEPVAKPLPAEVVSVPPTAEPEPEPTTAASAPTTKPSLASITPEPKPEPEFRVNGIFYNTAHPSAIVNGKTVGLKDKVNGATVVGIGRSTVLL